MTRSPAYSPEAPELGWREHEVNPVISASHVSRSRKISLYPSAWSMGTKGCSAANSGQVTPSMMVVALSFMVHEPRGVMLVFSERSRDSSLWRYRSISVSEW